MFDTRCNDFQDQEMQGLLEMLEDKEKDVDAMNNSISDDQYKVGKILFIEHLLTPRMVGTRAGLLETTKRTFNAPQANGERVF